MFSFQLLIDYQPNIIMSHHDNTYLSICQLKEELVSAMDSLVHGTLYFKVTSDQHLSKYHRLTIADGLEKNDSVQLELEEDVLSCFTKKGKFFFPGSIIKACALKMNKSQLIVTRNSYLSWVLPNQLPSCIDANKFESIPVEPARKDVFLKDLVQLTKTCGISQEVWFKIVDKFSTKKNGGNECYIFKCADHTERIVLKVWSSTHAPLIKNIKAGEYYKFRNLIFKYVEKKNEKNEEPGHEIYLQHVPRYTLFEKISPVEVASLPKIPPKFDLGDADFQGSIIAVEDFEWTKLCHMCSTPTKTSKCTDHHHGPEFDIRSYRLVLVGFDAQGVKKEFFTRKEQIEDWRNKDILLTEDMAGDEITLNQAFDAVLNKPINVIYNLSQKNECYTTHLNLIDTIADNKEPTKESKKKKKRAALVEIEAPEENKKAKKE